MSQQDNQENPAPTVGNNPANQWQGQDAGFRGRENATGPATEEFNDGADLPPMGRKRGRNNLITVAGYIFMALLAIAAVIAVNRTPNETVAKTETAPVANRLPGLVFPPPPAPPAAAMVGEEEAAVQITEEEDIWKRKMGGNLMAQGGGSSGSSGNKGARNSGGGNSTQQLENDRMAQLMMMGQGSNTSFVGPDGKNVDEGAQGGGVVNASLGGSQLGQRLKPTITEAVTATVLPRRNYLLAKGATLDCALETAIDSSVPGMTTCRLTRDVYSDNSRVLLLDRGTQLVGEYAGSLQRGQARMFLLWTRAKTPSGVVVDLNSPGTDSLGRSGISGYVDNHFWERFGAAILTSFIKDTVNVIVNNRTKKDGAQGGDTNIYGGTVQSGEQIVGSMLREQSAIPSTLIVNQGQHIQVLVARDLDFSQVYGLRVAQ